MALDREQRFLERQRGAGRELRNSGFGIALPGVSAAPLQPVRSGRSRRTSLQELQPQRISRKTPKATPLIPPISARKTPTASAAKEASGTGQADGKGEQTTGEVVVGSIGKRKRADDTPTRTTPRAIGTALPVRNLPTSTASTQILSGGQTKEDGVAKSSSVLNSSPGKKRKKRVSIGQQSRKRAKTGLKTPLFDQETAPPEAPSTANENISFGYPSLQASDAADISTHSQQPPSSEKRPKRKKRKSIGVVPKKRTSRDGVRTTPQEVESLLEETQSSEKKPRRKQRKSIATVPKKRKSQDGVRPAPQGGYGGTEAESLIEKIRSIPGRPGRRALQRVVEESEDGSGDKSGHSDREDDQASEVVAEEDPEISEDASVSARRTESKPKFPALRKSVPGKDSVSRSTKPLCKPDKNATTGQKISQQAHSSSVRNVREQRQRKERPDSIPITVYRMSQIQALDYPVENDDVLAGPAPFPKKGSVNAIDVLSQICREMITKTRESCEHSANKERTKRNREEWKRKGHAVEMFGDELNARLFQLTEALDNNYALNTRLKQANKERTSVREELLDLKRQREDVALRMDEVRAKHGKGTKVAQREDDLDTMLQDIELAVQRGQALAQTKGHTNEAQSVGLELRLRSVAANVSSHGGRSGLLDEVKAFNALLEHAITAL